jgi:hypothetical protein
MGKKKKAFSRAERKAQVKLQFAIWIQNGADEWATSYRIARALDMSNAGSFQRILDEMVDEGDLVKERFQNPGRWTTYKYTLTPGTFQRPRRTINFNAKGKSFGQLELFS